MTRTGTYWAYVYVLGPERCCVVILALAAFAQLLTLDWNEAGRAFLQSPTATDNVYYRKTVLNDNNNNTNSAASTTISSAATRSSPHRLRRLCERHEIRVGSWVRVELESIASLSYNID